ncbi:Na(+)/H(+) antiporter subunit G [Candidatus Entotheonellaceae bacterium PAL068K]
MIIAHILLISGLLFILAGVIGILRLPDFYTRLHAMGKCDTLGVALVLLALAFYEGLSLASLKILLIAVFVGLATPTSTHALGRAAFRAGLVPWRREKNGP